MRLIAGAVMRSVVRLRVVVNMGLRVVLIMRLGVGSEVRLGVRLNVRLSVRLEVGFRVRFEVATRGSRGSRVSSATELDTSCRRAVVEVLQ